MLNERSDLPCASTSADLSLLLAGAEPWRGRDKVVQHLLSVWITRFQLTHCALFWQVGSSQRTVCMIQRDSNPTVENGSSSSPQFQIDRIVSRAEFAQLAPPQFHPLRSLAWKADEVEHSEVCIRNPAFGLLPAIAWEKIDQEWVATSMILLDWAGQFQEELQSKKLSALAEYAAGAGHEINNPLGSIIGRTSQLLKMETDLEKRRLLETIGAQAYRIGDMIGDTMLFADPPPLQPHPVELTEIVRNVLTRFESELATQQVMLDLYCENETIVLADTVQIQIVIAELIRNSLQSFSRAAARTTAWLQIRCTPVEREDQPGGLLVVTDNGPGLTAEQQEHCFDPFYSGRQAGRGLGFGLSKCWRIVQQHAGKITLETAPEQTSVYVWLPTPVQGREIRETGNSANNAIF